MSPRPRVAGLVAAVALATAVAVAAAATPVVAATARPRVTLASQDLWVGPTGTVTAVLELHDVAAGSTLAPLVYGAVPTRSAFALTMKGEALSGSGQALDVHRLAKGDGRVIVRFRVDDGAVAPDGPPPPGDVVTWTGTGVHPIAFTLAAADGSTIDTVISYVVRLAARPTAGTPAQVPLRVATELRLDAPPSADGSGRPVVATATRRDASALVAGLAGLADDGDTSSGFAFAVTPEVVDSLAQSARASDRDLLVRLDDLTGDHPLQRLPWVSIDLARWLATPGLVDHASSLVDAGVGATERHLHAPDPSVADLPAWNGSSSDAQVAWLARGGATGVLVPEDELSPLDASAFPRSLAAPFTLDYGQGRTVTAAQLDTALSAHFTADDPVLGANHLLADLAVVALDLPAISRGVVVAPPPGWTPSAAFLGAYVDGLAAATPVGTVPLVTPASPAEVLAQVPAARAAGDLTTQGDPLVRTLRAGGTPKPLAALARELDRTQAKVVSLASMVPGGATRSAAISTSLTRRVDRAASADLDPEQRSRRLAAVRSSVDGMVATVRLPTSQTITLTSDTADIPLTIHRTPSGPTMIRLDFEANTRLTFDKGTSQLVRLNDETTQLRIRVHSDSPGDSVVQVTATSPNGTLLVGTSKLVVRSTAASGMGLLISFGSLAFLLVWWGRDIFRVRRRRRASRVRPADLIDV